MVVFVLPTICLYNFAAGGALRAARFAPGDGDFVMVTRLGVAYDPQTVRLPLVEPTEAQSAELGRVMAHLGII